MRTRQSADGHWNEAYWRAVLRPWHREIPRKTLDGGALCPPFLRGTILPAYSSHRVANRLQWCECQGGSRRNTSVWIWQVEPLVSRRGRWGSSPEWLSYVTWRIIPPISCRCRHCRWTGHGRGRFYSSWHTQYCRIPVRQTPWWYTSCPLAVHHTSSVVCVSQTASIF